MVSPAVVKTPAVVNTLDVVHVVNTLWAVGVRRACVQRAAGAGVHASSWR